MSEDKKTNEEEVDLGSLFIIIGKGISNVFRYIKRFFLSLFELLIELLLFLKLNLFKIGLGAFIGSLLGLSLEVTGDTKYLGTLQVQPNFESTRQLYNNVNYYNDLVKQKEVAVLARTFKISEEEASSFKKFEIKPVVNENNVLKAYNQLILSVDTLTVKSYSFEKFKNSFTKFDYKSYDINVLATKNNVFNKLDETIIGSITDNKYFDNLKKINEENLNSTQKLIRKNLSQVDSLHNIYKRVLLEKAKQTNSGTTIDLSTSGVDSKEIELFQTNRQLNSDLKQVSKNLTEKSEIINVISNFQPIGHEIKEIEKNKAFQLGLVGAFLAIIVLLVMQLNRYLSTYEK